MKLFSGLKEVVVHGSGFHVVSDQLIAVVLCWMNRIFFLAGCLRGN